MNRKTDRYTYFRPKKLGRKSKDFYVFDTETGIKYPDGTIEYILSARPEHFLFGVIYGKDGYLVIDSIERFKREFKKRRYKNKIVFAHNAEYDLSCLYGNIYHLDSDAIFNGKFICATNGVCQFADSYNILPTSVKKLGMLLGIEKKDLGNNLKSHIKLLDKDIDYCVRDCEIAYKSLKKIFDPIEPSFTIGSISLKLFRKKYLKHTIKINRELSDKFFNAYYGGRTEAFKLGECHGNVYDINSAYPWAKLTGKFINPATLREINYSDLQKNENINGMVTATVYVEPDEYLPVLPYRFENKLLFPAGTFCGTWMLSEFKYALEHSKTNIVDIHNVIIGETIQSPFKDFVTDIYEIRNKTNDDFERYYYKLFLNNLYGKLVQHTKDCYKFFDNEHDAIKYVSNEKLSRAELIKVTGGYFCRYDKEKIFSHTIAPWGAEITAQVRMKLHAKMRENESSILYCDTDSIFLNKKLTEKNDLSLGGWKHETKIITNIRALKDYVYYEDNEQKQMLKGVKKTSIPYDEYGNVFKYKRMIKTRESFLRKDNLPPGTFIDQIKFVSGDYKKRQILKHGHTKPFIL